MGQPDRDSAMAWGGKLLVDRDGSVIGTCTEIFLDDATGLPEWATADVSGGPAFVPLVDAAEADDRVRVAVLQAAVADAPSVGDPRHLSEDEEERLYRHYGITFSRDDSDSLLPTAAPPTNAAAADTAAQAGTPADVVQEPVSLPDVPEAFAPTDADATGCWPPPARARSG